MNVIHSDRQIDVIDVDDKHCPLCRGPIKYAFRFSLALSESVISCSHNHHPLSLTTIRETELISLQAFQPIRLPEKPKLDIRELEQAFLDNDDIEFPDVDSLLPKNSDATTSKPSDSKASIVAKDLSDPFVSSTKIDLLFQMLEQSTTEDPGSKVRSGFGFYGVNWL